MDTIIRWNEKISYPSETNTPSGILRVCVRRAAKEFPFTHDTSVTVLGGKLFVAWYQCTQGEIEGQTQICGAWSADDGLTWSEPELVIGDGAWHYVPAAFYEDESGIAHGLVTCMTGHDRPVCVVELLYLEKKWVKAAQHDIRFLFNTAPFRLADGTWIAGGRFAPEKGMLPLVPGVVRRESGWTDWELISFSGPWDDGKYVLDYPETAIFVCDDAMHAVVRCDKGAAFTYRGSEDGTKWEFAGQTNLPAIGAKWYGGTLPDGRAYLLFNESVEADERIRLVLLIREHGTEGFTRRYVLAQGWDDSIECGPWWHYPCACVWKEYLYVSCTANQEETVRNAVCMRIPLAEL